MIETLFAILVIVAICCAGLAHKLDRLGAFRRPRDPGVHHLDDSDEPRAVLHLLGPRQHGEADRMSDETISARSRTIFGLVGAGVIAAGGVFVVVGTTPSHAGSSYVHATFGRRGR